MREKSIKFALGAIVLIALLVRIVPYASSPERRRGGFGIFGDTYTYHTIAYNLYTDRGFTAIDDGEAFGNKIPIPDLEYVPAATRGPGYPYFLYVIYRLFGDEQRIENGKDWHVNWDRARYAQCILDTLTCLMVFFIARLIYNRSHWPAVISCLIYAFNPYTIFYTKALLSETLSAFLLTGAVLSFIAAIRTEKPKLYFISGIAIGLTALTRAEYILFPLISVALLAWSDKGGFKRVLKKSCIYICGVMLVMVPWTARNYHTFHKFFPVAVGGAGSQLYAGTIETKENWIDFENYSDDAYIFEGEKEEAIALRKQFLPTIMSGSIKVAELDDEYKNMAFRRIRHDPVGWLLKSLKRAPRIWYQDYKRMYADREASGNFFKVYFLLALLALFLNKGEVRSASIPIWAVFIYLTLIFAPSHVEPRYSIPAMASFVSLSGVGLWGLLGKLKFLQHRIE